MKCVSGLVSPGHGATPLVQEYCLCQLEKPFYHAENGVCCKLLAWKTAMFLACAVEPPKRWCRDVFSFSWRESSSPQSAACEACGVCCPWPPSHTPSQHGFGPLSTGFGEGCVSDVLNQSSWKCSHGISLTPSPAVPGLPCFQTLQALLSQQQLCVSFLLEAPFFALWSPL